MSRLNPAQREAVEHGSGPMLILAGAGSGKTLVITRRIAALIERGVAPPAIVAVTFTNKAAHEMAQRMIPLVGARRAARIRTSTFHSFGLALLKEESRAAGLDARCVIFDQGDSLGLVKEILREHYRARSTRRLDPQAVLARISNWKCAMVLPAGVAESDHEYDRVAAQVYPEYMARLEAMRALDFDDLVCRPVRLLRDDVRLRSRWQGRIEHLLVDEFQDTSAVQLELVKLLANDRRNVCVVGDDDQSIYSWRGADVGNILRFESHFPGTRLIKLETNYRSCAPILEVANAVIGQSQGQRHAKTLRAARAGGDAVHLCACDNPAAEARFVAAEIRRLGERAVPLEQIAVLYRSNQQARLIEQELKSGSISYRLFGGQQFFDRKEVKDTAAYLRIVVNPYDEISLRRVINVPPRGIGTRSVQLIDEHAQSNGLSFVEAFARAETIAAIPEGARRSLGALNELIRETRAGLDRSGTLHAAAVGLVERIDLRSALDDTAEGGAQGEQRYRNVEHLLNWLATYERGGARSKRSLQDFLQLVTLNGDTNDTAERGTGVTLCTLHAAKGLEFSVVFLIGCVEGQLPHSRTTDPRAHEARDGDLDEERRLFYVGITRARDRLYLSTTRRRMLRGKAVEVTPSRYMDELPVEHVQNYDPPEEQDLSFDELSALARDLLSKHRRAAAAGAPGGDSRADAE